MVPNLDRYKQDLHKLRLKSYQLLSGMQLENEDRLNQRELEHVAKTSKDLKPLPFKPHYEEWYSESLELLRQVVPNRVPDFIDLYKKEKRELISPETYCIADYMIGLTTCIWDGTEAFNHFRTAASKFLHQIRILESVDGRFESALFDIRQLVQADLFDSELESSRALLKSGFVRPAGALAGIVLEKHLRQVCANHNLSIPLKNPSICDLSETLKKSSVIEVSAWRFIQHLADLRNLCDRDKVRDPSPEQGRDLIDGVEKIIKTIA